MRLFNLKRFGSLAGVLLHIHFEVVLLLHFLEVAVVGLGACACGNDFAFPHREARPVAEVAQFSREGSVVLEQPALGVVFGQAFDGCVADCLARRGCHLVQADILPPARQHLVRISIKQLADPHIPWSRLVELALL